MQLRSFARPDIPTVADLRTAYARLRGRVEITPEELGSSLDLRVLVGMLEQAGLVRRGFDAGRAMQIEVPDPPVDASERIHGLLERYEREAFARADRLITFAGALLRRHRQVAEHFGETLADDLRHARRLFPARRARRARAPGRGAAPGRRRGDDPPSGPRAALAARPHRPAAMLQGSISAPRSARRSPHFGALAAATQADVKRWIQLLELSGALEALESDDGFRLLRGVLSAQTCPGSGRPRAAPWTSASSKDCARGASSAPAPTRCPPSSSCTTRALRELATAKPETVRDLAAVKGFGPTKLERYGEDVLAVIAAA